MKPLNYCRACRQDFASVEVFDRHHLGDHELDYPEHEEGRRCLDVEEMEALGWKQNAKGRWHDPARSARAQKAFSGLRGAT